MSPAKPRQNGDWTVSLGEGYSRESFEQNQAVED